MRRNRLVIRVPCDPYVAEHGTTDFLEVFLEVPDLIEPENVGVWLSDLALRHPSLRIIHVAEDVQVLAATEYRVGEVGGP